MEVIPAINEIDFELIRQRINVVKDFGAKWVHIDAADGKFTPNFLWNNPRDLDKLQLHAENFEPKIGVHLMIENPDEVLDSWIEAGVKRIIIHLETIKNIWLAKKHCDESGVEFVAAISPKTPTKSLFKYEGFLNQFLILAVNPGLGSQKFQKKQLEKIKILRKAIPDAKIQVDGGINLKTAKEIKKAGANSIISCSYIWKNKEPKKAYQKLLAI